MAPPIVASHDRNEDLRARTRALFVRRDLHDNATHKNKSVAGVGGQSGGGGGAKGRSQRRGLQPKTTRQLCAKPRS